MCTKSKASYGCGHHVKITEPCVVPDCNSMERWKIPGTVYKDCPRCKDAPEIVTRGREGRGRHAREIRSRVQTQSSSDSLSAPESPSSTGTATPYLSISPWAPPESPRSKEKKWDTPTRQKADTAWLVEHERRMSDLDEAASKMSLKGHRESRHSSRKSSPRSSYEQVISADEIEEPEEIYRQPSSQPRSIKMLPFEIESEYSISRRHSRKTSRDTEDGALQYRDLVLSRRKTQCDVPNSDHPDEPSSRQLIRTTRRTKTEPYYPQSCGFEPSVTMVSTNYPIVGRYSRNRYEIVQPLQHNFYYPRPYAVY